MSTKCFLRQLLFSDADKVDFHIKSFPSRALI